MENALPPLKEQMKAFVTNPVFLACLFSWFGAQFLKAVINLIYGRIRSFGELVEVMVWRTGGMPSSHSALVAALCTTIGFRNGICSDIFILSFAFFLITIRDAVGVRRSSGMQAQKINELGRELESSDIIGPYKPLKEINGHTPMQVLVGCVLGFFIGLAFSLLK